MKIAFHLEDIWDYGKLIAYAIDRNIDVNRAVWNENETDDYAYFICYNTRCLYRRDTSTLIKTGYYIDTPTFKHETDGKVSMYLSVKYDYLLNQS